MRSEPDPRDLPLAPGAPFEEAAELAGHLVGAIFRDVGFVVDRVPAVVLGQLVKNDRSRSGLNVSRLVADGTRLKAFTVTVITGATLSAELRST